MNNNKVTEPLNANSLRQRYILQFVLFVIIVIILYIWNPLGLFTTYAGPSIFITLFLGIFLITMIVFYDYLFKNPGISNVPKNFSFNIFFILFAFLISAGLIVLLLWCLGIFSNKSSSNDSNNGVNIINFIINFLLLFVMLAIVYKILTLTPLGKSPFFKVILYSIFYIPCLFLNLFEMIVNEYHKTTKTIIILLVIEIFLIVLYFIYPSINTSFYIQGGKQLINLPIALNNTNSIATYQTLNNNSEKYSYQYAISFWFNIDSMPPSTNKNYSNYTNLLTYGDNPCIQYNASTNTLLITVKRNNDNNISIVDLTHQLEVKLDDATIGDEINNLKNQIKQTINKVNTIPIQNEIDSKGNRIIYLKKNILLQKWNNLIINYNGGTLDIFLNGKLEKSAVGVVPYITYDTLIVGSDNGLSGGISNLIYYNKTLDIFNIKKLYNTMKDKNPPSTSDNNKNII
jgi:hypothetical protein